MPEDFPLVLSDHKRVAPRTALEMAVDSVARVRWPHQADSSLLTRFWKARFFKKLLVAASLATQQSLQMPMLGGSFAHVGIQTVQSTSAVPMELTTMSATKASRLDQLTSVEFVPPSSLELEFTDKIFMMSVADLEIPDGYVAWETAEASEFGDKMTVKGTNGKNVPIDAATLRYLVDPDFAAILDAQLAGLQLSEEELQRLVLDNQPPDMWFDEPETDSTHESWK